MTTSFHSASLGVFVRMLTNLQGIMAKAEAYAAERKFNPDVYVGMRLAPDMHSFAFQIQNGTDRAKLFAGRVSGEAPPSWPDTEKTWSELKERLQKALDFLKGIDAGRIDGKEAAMIPLRVNGESVEWAAEDYLLTNALPNFYFHVTTAYNLLRHAGVPLGKRDFTG
ncbi:MAG: DUF1993 domain-containing protein [Devosia sp.]